MRELSAFVAIVENRSFVRAAAVLGVSASALSQSIRQLEERLNIRVLNRTTRAVSPTEAGMRLFEHVQPALAKLADVSEVVSGFRDRPAGNLRINAPHYFTTAILAPHIGRFSQTYPDILLEIVTDDALIDIVKDKFDAGIRLGESVARDMVAVKLGGDQRMIAVASVTYLAEHGIPRTPRDLRKHRCLAWRMRTTGALYRWELEKNGRELELDVKGPLIASDGEVLKSAAIAGAGIAYLMESQVHEELADGTLLRVLEDWCPSFPGFSLYYPDRRRVPVPLRTFIDFMKQALAPKPTQRP